ncbi:MAG: acetyl-CoA C-acetyltransferase [Candidatus Izemoplasmatales bacterium]|nr:acetyl-CoA C-acetyltransferase [Candidatus Izemoplasmatales bacterium]
MRKVLIVAAKRSPIGSFLGTLKDVHPVDLGVQVLKKTLEEASIPLDQIDEVIVGSVLQAGLGQNMARQISIKTGLSQSIPAYSINMVCGSGMKSVMNAVSEIQSGNAELIVAGGVESMSSAPYLVSAKIRDGVKMGDMSLQDVILQDGLLDSFTKIHMGITAENIADKYHISREEQDAFALSSQLKAIQAVDAGVFDPEIIPIEIKTKKETIVFARDEYPNRTTNAEKLAKLRPAFKTDGSVTAGNASGINDGASFLVLASEKAVEKYNLIVLGEIVACAEAGVDPNLMGMGPVPAIRKALMKASKSLEEIQLIELNEAFAAQSLGVIRELASEHKCDILHLMQKTNQHGGAIALGHPVGMSGNRIIVTLLHEMRRQQSVYGLASLCIGGGMGTAVIIKVEK